jgi:diguanylate cyclase (GGDEF)-like protein/PAS domain S-box-containing protein
MPAILDEWEKFAGEIPSASNLSPDALRGHARGMLEAIAIDLEKSQSPVQQDLKAKGRGPPPAQETHAELHGSARVAAGFNVNETMAEFRALRASVLRLWSGRAEDCGTGDEIVRFNEAIDQALTESLSKYTGLKEKQTRLFNILLTTSPDLNYIIDTNGVLLYANKAFARLFKSRPSSLIGENVFDLSPAFGGDMHKHVHQVIRAGNIYRAEMTAVLEDGNQAIYEHLLVPVVNAQDRCEAIAGIGRDVTERKILEENIRRSANYDHLTGLPNRTLFRERLEHEIKHCTRTGLPLALLFIDLDGFKEVNDRLGHIAGDQLLQQVARRIGLSIRDTDIVARLGGDEFTVVLTDVTNLAHVETLAAKIWRALKQPFILDSDTALISASIGIAIYPRDARTAEELIRNADAVMYDAKRAGRNRYRFFIDKEDDPGPA